MQPSGEAVLISALLNNHDVQAASFHGITSEHFQGYRDEYNWLLTYLEFYKTDPTWEAFLDSFKSFPRCDHEDIRSACDMVFRSYDRIQITEAMSDAMDLLGMGDVAAAHGVLAGVELHRTAPKPKKLLTDLDFLDRWDEDMGTAIEVPYRTLQRYTGGIRPGNIWYISARPSQGKSAHLVSIAAKAVRDGCRVKFYSLEMNEDEVRFRFHALLANHYGYKGITLDSLRDRRTDKHKYKEFISELADRVEGHLDIHTYRDGVVTPGVVMSTASEYDLNIVDYVGLMRQDNGARSVDDWRVAASISNDLKMIGGMCNTRMLVATQINREGDHGTEAPKLRNMAQTDALGQDGDVVLTMRALPRNVATLFSIEKNRHGPQGLGFCTTFDPNVGVFQEITREQAEDMAMAAEELS